MLVNAKISSTSPFPFLRSFFKVQDDQLSTGSPIAVLYKRANNFFFFILHVLRPSELLA